MAIFPTARDARNLTKDVEIIHHEIRTIESQILDDSKMGLMFSEVLLSYMTAIGTPAAQMYYSVWMGNVINETLKQQMADVIRHFQDRGYKIFRVKNNSTMNTFKWVVRW